MPTCVFVVGTRAQLVKVSPVLRLAAAAGLPHSLYLAGQHRDSMDALLEDFDIDSPLVQPAAATERSSVLRLLTWLPGAFLACRRYLRQVAAEDGAAPLVVVHGDTLSTLTGALAARSCGAAVAHMESGLSSLKLFDPFPEEAVRRLVFRLLHFALCPNAAAAGRMRRYRPDDIVDTGENTLLDTVRYALAKPAADPGVPAGDYAVASIHRFENIYRRRRLASLVDELVDIAAQVPLLFVLHPPTAARLRRYGLLGRLESAPGLRLSPRLPYSAFLRLLADARLVLTDGGSNQEELTYLGVPTVLLREVSERPDGLGGNVVFRREIAGSLAAFLANGGAAALRRERRVDADAEPSRRTLEALQRWSDGPTNDRRAGPAAA